MAEITKTPEKTLYVVVHAVIRISDTQYEAGAVIDAAELGDNLEFFLAASAIELVA